MQIVMIGTGYVGLVTGTCFAEIGHSVVCVDLNPEKIRLLKDGISPIFEPGLDDMIKRNIAQDRLRFSTSLESSLPGAEVAFIAVGTPEGEDGAADLGYVRNVAQAIGQGAQNDLVVVVKSTVPVGSCDMVQELIDNELQKRPQAEQFAIDVASNPEFLKEGDAINDFMRPDRIVIGLNNEHLRQVFQEVYKPFYLDDPAKLLIMDRRSSELTKYGANAMLATRISFMNELAHLCENLGANIDSIRLGMGMDSRIGRKFLYAGPGYGGSCFPKDVQALLKSAEDNGIDLSVLQAVSKANDRQKVWAGEKIVKFFGSLSGKTVAVWGLAFKPGTDDVREAPALSIIAQLAKSGAKINAHDPQAMTNFQKAFQPMGHEIHYASDAYDALDGADALVLLTEWSEYRRPHWDRIKKRMRSPHVFDLRNQYDPAPLMAMGFHYQCIGRPDSAQV